MGIFNKLINYMTGFSAEVGVEIDNANLKAPFPVGIGKSITRRPEHGKSIHAYSVSRRETGRFPY